MDRGRSELKERKEWTSPTSDRTSSDPSLLTSSSVNDQRPSANDSATSSNPPVETKKGIFRWLIRPPVLFRRRNDQAGEVETKLLNDTCCLRNEEKPSPGASELQLHSSQRIVGDSSIRVNQANGSKPTTEDSYHQRQSGQSNSGSTSARTSNASTSVRIHAASESLKQSPAEYAHHRQSSQCNAKFFARTRNAPSSVKEDVPPLDCFLNKHFCSQGTISESVITANSPSSFRLSTSHDLKPPLDCYPRERSSSQGNSGTLDRTRNALSTCAVNVVHKSMTSRAQQYKQDGYSGANLASSSSSPWVNNQPDSLMRKSQVPKDASPKLVPNAEPCLKRKWLLQPPPLKRSTNSSSLPLKTADGKAMSKRYSCAFPVSTWASSSDIPIVMIDDESKVSDDPIVTVSSNTLSKATRGNPNKPPDFKQIRQVDLTSHPFEAEIYKVIPKRDPTSSQADVQSKGYNSPSGTNDEDESKSDDIIFLGIFSNIDRSKDLRLSLQSGPIAAVPNDIGQPYTDVVSMSVFEKIRDAQMALVRGAEELCDTDIVVGPKEDDLAADTYYVHRVMERLSTSEDPQPEPDPANNYQLSRSADGISDEPRFLVLWYGYGISDVTAIKMSDLRGSKEELQRLDIKNLGLRSIIKYGSHQSFSPTFGFHHLPDPSKLKKQRHIDEVLPIDYGYWRIKILEIEWLKVLDPNADGGGQAPLYIESFDLPGALAQLPNFEFGLASRFSKQAAKEYQRVVGNLLQNRYDQRQLVESSKGSLPHDPGTCLCPCRGICDICSDMEGNTSCRFQNGRLVIGPKGNCAEATPFLVTCSTRQCDCPEDCENQPSFLKNGRQFALCVFYENATIGWGVRALEKIPRGAYINEYIGEVRTKSECRLTDPKFQMECPGGMFIIDALKVGNESRFYSHSCEPNSVVVRVHSEGLSDELCRFGIFSLRDIQKGEPITCDYSPTVAFKPKDSLGKTTDCLCRSTRCRGFMMV